MTLYFLIPVYNEAINIKTLFNNLNNSITDREKFYVFVDDASTDTTVQEIEQYFRNSSYYIIKKERNIGPGHSFNLGFEWILAHSKDNNDIVITIEADNTSDISILENMIKISELGYDLVLASVYAQGGGFEKTNIFRKIVSFIANMLFRMFFNIKVLTLSSFYRVYKIKLLRKLKEKYNVIITEKGFISMLEILLKAIQQDAKIIEVPMILKSGQRKDKSKMKILKTTFSYISYLVFKRKLHYVNQAAGKKVRKVLG